MKLIDMWKTSTKSTKIIISLIIMIILVVILFGIDAGLVKNTVSGLTENSSTPESGASPF